MQKMTIGTKNQIVIPKEIRQRIKGLRPGRVVHVYALDKETIAIKIPQKNWIERTYGMLKGSLPEGEAIRQLEEMRKEWDER